MSRTWAHALVAKRLVGAALFIWLTLGGAGWTEAKDPSLPENLLTNRPAGAPELRIPGFTRLQTDLDEQGTISVIVRFRDDAGHPQGFQAEGKIKNAKAIKKQRTAIRQQQDVLRGRLPQHSAAAAKQFAYIPFLAVTVDAEGLEALINSPEVDLIEEDVAHPPALADSIPLLGGDMAGEFSGYTGAGQTVAVLDTGVDSSHPFLAGKVVEEACYSSTMSGSISVCPNGSSEQIGPGSGGNCNQSISGCFHGTHVAGIVAGSGPGFSGVAKDADIIAMQVFSQFTSSANCGASVPCALTWNSDYLKALERVYELRDTYSIAAVNMSLGGGFNAGTCDGSNASIKAAIDNLRSVGIPTVIASGNSGYTNGIGSPACISTAVSVGSTTKSDSVASYSNSSTFLHLLAPGSSIQSSMPGGSYSFLNGTSMAAPHVAGAWAVIKSKKPDATVDEVLAALAGTGTNVADYRNGIVKPRINVAAALGQFVVDPRLQFGAASYTVAEDGGSVTIVIKRDGSATGAVSVDWATGSGSATAGSDYTAASGTVFFSDGDISDKSFTVAINDDALAEPTETFSLTLSNPTGGAFIGSRNTTQVGITDNDFFAVSGNITANGSPLAGVSLGATYGASCTDSASDGNYTCQAPYNWSGTIMPSLANYLFSPGSIYVANATANQNGHNFVGTELAESVWYDDAVPAGAATVGTWNWVGSSPAPYSGSLAHKSDLAAGIHRHYFHNPTSGFPLKAGESLFAYVYIDPANPPRELMLQFNIAGSWDRRAYWGENLIAYGTNGTASRYRVGDLPAAGGWVRLEVPVAVVDLAGRSLNGIAFTHYDGRATWDRVGKLGPAPAPQLAFSAATYTAAEDSGSATITVVRGGSTNGAVSVDWATGSGSATAGSDYTAASGTLNFASGETSKTFALTIADDSSYEGSETVPLSLGTVTGGELGSQATAVLTISDDEPVPNYTLSGKVTINGAALAGVVFTDSNGGTCTDSDASGDFSCSLQHGWSGSVTASLNNYLFSPTTLSYTPVTGNLSGQNFSATEIAETLWYDDAVPAGAATVGTWNWVGSSPAPYSGSLAHKSDLAAGIHRHYFHNPTSGFPLKTGESLFAYVYIDPANPPRELMLQFNIAGSWNRRAYWGENLIAYGTNGTASRYRVGNLPAAGGWVRLEVPVAVVDLAGRNLNGIAFTHYDGRATWDRVGKLGPAPAP